jgi:hypothetical protein
LRKQFYGDWHELVAKDIFYSYGLLAKGDKREMGILLDRAIHMMRSTNPKNLNLAYMLEAYVLGLVHPTREEYHVPYLESVTPSTNENKYEVGERYLREALAIFYSHYESPNVAIYTNECYLAYTLAVQRKWTDFDQRFSVCRQGEAALTDESLRAMVADQVKLIRKELGSANRPE